MTSSITAAGRSISRASSARSPVAPARSSSSAPTTRPGRSSRATNWIDSRRCAQCATSRLSPMKCSPITSSSRDRRVPPAACRREPMCCRSDGGWYAVLQVPSIEPEEDLAVGLLNKDGILTHPGFFFDFPHESFLVVSLLTPEAAFRDGVARILRHFDCNVADGAPAATPPAQAHARDARKASASGGGAPRETKE